MTTIIVAIIQVFQEAKNEVPGSVHNLTSRAWLQSRDFPISWHFFFPSIPISIPESQTSCILESGIPEAAAHRPAISAGGVPAWLPATSLSCRNNSHCQNFLRRVISFPEMEKEGCFAWGISLKRSNFLKW